VLLGTVEVWTLAFVVFTLTTCTIFYENWLTCFTFANLFQTFLKQTAFPPQSLYAWMVWWWHTVTLNTWNCAEILFRLSCIGNDMVSCCGQFIQADWFGRSISSLFSMRLFNDAVKTVEILQLRIKLECGEDGEWIKNLYCLLGDTHLAFTGREWKLMGYFRV